MAESSKISLCIGGSGLDFLSRCLYSKIPSMILQWTKYVHHAKVQSLAGKKINLVLAKNYEKHTYRRAPG